MMRRSTSPGQFAFNYLQSTPGALANGAQLTIVDIASAAVFATSTFAWRIQLDLAVGKAGGALPPQIHVLVLPANTAVPAMLNNAQVAGIADYHWMTLYPVFRTEVATGSFFSYRAEPRSTRKFNVADRIVYILVNNSGGAYTGIDVAGHQEFLFKPRP